jgi:hypothetical protein
MVDNSDEQAGTTALIVASHTDTLKSGFIYWVVQFLLSLDRPGLLSIKQSAWHEMFALNYKDTTNKPPNIVLDVTNSFVSTTPTAKHTRQVNGM